MIKRLRNMCLEWKKISRSSRPPDTYKNFASCTLCRQFRRLVFRLSYHPISLEMLAGQVESKEVYIVRAPD